VRSLIRATWLMPIIGFAAVVGSAYAQPDTSQAVHRIGVITAPVMQSAVEDALRAGLRELGYIEGKSIIIDWRRSVGTDEELRSLAHDLANSKVELIVATATPSARAALQATSLPVVFASGDPVGAGLTVGLAKPGGNATGVSATTPELTAKRVDIGKSTRYKLWRASDDA
jgi:putative ABC transport system substrate-binding protein